MTTNPVLEAIRIMENNGPCVKCGRPRLNGYHTKLAVRYEHDYVPTAIVVEPTSEHTRLIERIRDTIRHMRDAGCYGVELTEEKIQLIANHTAQRMVLAYRLTETEEM